MLEAGFRLFTERTIEAVPLTEVAKESGVGIATLYRYYGSKLELAVAVSVWKWDEYLAENKRRHADAGSYSGRERLGFFLDTFLDLYRSHRELLRYNQLFNVYVQGTDATPEQMAPYARMIGGVEKRFREIWETGARDGTLRVDTPWEQAFSALLHIMLSAVTRHAVGLLYKPEGGSDPERELRILRDAMLRQYAAEPDAARR